MPPSLSADHPHSERGVGLAPPGLAARSSTNLHVPPHTGGPQPGTRDKALVHVARLALAKVNIHLRFPSGCARSFLPSAVDTAGGFPRPALVSLPLPSLPQIPAGRPRWGLCRVCTTIHLRSQTGPSCLANPPPPEQNPLPQAQGLGIIPQSRPAINNSTRIASSPRGSPHNCCSCVCVCGCE